MDLVADAVWTHDAHRTLERQRVLHGFGVDGRVSWEFACLVVIRKIRHAIQVRSVLFAILWLVKHAPIAVRYCVERFWIDSMTRRLDFELVVEDYGRRPVSFVVPCTRVDVKLHHHHARSVERDAHIAHSLVERTIAARGLCSPIDCSVVLSAIVSVERDVPDSDKISVVEDNSSAVIFAVGVCVLVGTKTKKKN